MMPRDYHAKPLPNERTVEDALWSAERRRTDLPQAVQVFARDWDPVILADEIYRLKRELEKCQNL